MLNWFKENHMKAYLDIHHLLVSSDESFISNIEDFSINNITDEKLLRVKFDSYLSFENHVTCLCKKASQKLLALRRISHYMNLNKWRNLMKLLLPLSLAIAPLYGCFPVVI